MKTISIGGICLFLTIPLIAMELSIEDKKKLSDLCKHNAIPNSLDIPETNKKTDFTVYDCYREIFLESNFTKDNSHIQLNDTDYISLEPNEYVPDLFHVAIKSPAKTELLLSNHESRIISFALSDDKKEIAVGCDDGHMTVFNISDYPTYSSYDRNCSMNPLISVAFIDKKHIITTDSIGEVQLLNTETNVLLHITGKPTALKCPSYNADHILIVKKFIFTPSSDLPCKFLNHTFTPKQSDFLFQIAEIRNNKINGFPPTSYTIQEIQRTLNECQFELPVKEALEKKLLCARQKPKKPILTSLKEGCFQILQHCYTEFIEQPVNTQSITSDNV